MNNAIIKQAFDFIAPNTLGTEELEETLQIKSWGYWAQERSAGSYPAWVYEMQKDWNRTHQPIPDPISEDYAARLDGIIAKLPDRKKGVLIGLYVGNRGVNELARIMNTTKYVIRNERDAALYVLYGALKIA